jgi:RNA polymerase sigma-70 factor, ECF subfamily
VPYESSSYLMAVGGSSPGSRSLPELPPATATSSQDRNQRLTTAVTLHFDAVWRLLRRLGVREADVDDAAQQVFLALDRRLLDVPVERERAFLLSAAVRIAANARRQARRSREEAGVDEESASDGTSPERALEHRQLMAELDQALSSLSDEQRTVFVLYEIEGRSLPEIARSLEIPLGTATSRLRRARDGFETWLAERRLREEQP